MDQIGDFTKVQYKSAEVRLALLKESFDFYRFFEKFTNDPYSTCPELRKPDEDWEEHSSRVHLMEVKGNPFFGGYAERFGVNDRFLLLTQEANPPIPLAEILILLNPQKDISEVSSQELLEILPAMFYLKGIHEQPIPTVRSKIITKTERSASGEIVQWNEVSIKGERPLELYEKVIKIDLRKKKPQLMNEFEKLIDRELGIWRAGNELELPSYVSWAPQSKRERKEALDQLQVWHRRKQKKSFREISKDLGITEDLAKKRFYRAYELTQRKPYDPEVYRKTALSPKKDELLKTCDKCKDKKCFEQLRKSLDWAPCPEVASYIEQDKVSLGERIISVRDEEDDKLKGVDDLLDRWMSLPEQEVFVSLSERSSEPSDPDT